MRNNLLDELIADYMGITAAAGRYRADWFLRFMGLESFPAYREGGRLQIYRGQPPLSEGAFGVLGALVKDIAENLQHVSDGLGFLPGSPEVRAGMLLALCGFRLEDLATPDAPAVISEAMRRGIESLHEAPDHARRGKAVRPRKHYFASDAIIRRVKVGIVREVAEGERRVGLVPETVGRLIKDGFEVVVESGAGRDYNLDENYEDAGANIVDGPEDVYSEADILVKVQSPTEEEIGHLREGQVLVCFLNGPQQPELVENWPTPG